MVESTREPPSSTVSSARRARAPLSPSDIESLRCRGGSRARSVSIAAISARAHSLPFVVMILDESSPGAGQDGPRCPLQGLVEERGGVVDHQPSVEVTRDARLDGGLSGADEIGPFEVSTEPKNA